MASRNGRVPANEAKVSASGADAKTEIAVQTPLIKALPRANGRIKAEASEEPDVDRFVEAIMAPYPISRLRTAALRKARQLSKGR